MQDQLDGSEAGESRNTSDSEDVLMMASPRDLLRRNVLTRNSGLDVDVQANDDGSDAASSASSGDALMMRPANQLLARNETNEGQ